MEYRSHQYASESNNSFAVKLENLVREIIIQNDIPYYRIESGVEHHTEAGAEENLPVIRIITYFEDTVNKISHILHDEFMVDIEKSVDKKKIRIETFAYKNINLTATLTSPRQKQTEYKRSGDRKFEIQICSMLQDAWTGIEKELGYDTAVIPDEAKRDFYRVGALLEMADIEFLKIRSELSQKLGKSAPVAVQQPVMKTEAPVQAAPVKNTNTFVEHLQAVAKEVQKEAPVVPAAPQPAAMATPPAQEFSKVVPPAPQPEVRKAPPVQQQPVYTPPPAPPVQQQPVYTPPAPPVQQPVYTPPVQQQPVYTPPAPPVQQPVVQQPAIAAQAPAQKTPASTPSAQPIAPQRVAPATPPTGIAPKPTVIPPAETSVGAMAAGELDSLRQLAESINQAPAAKQEPAAPKEQPEPIATPVAETPKPAPEAFIPPVEKIVELPRTQVPPVEVVSHINVNGNGTFEKTQEVVQQNIEKAVPFYNEVAKPVKAVQLDENAPMTDLMLREYVASSNLVKEIDQRIAERAGARINNDIDIEGDVERLRFLKVYTLKQLHERLNDNRDDIVAFAEKWIGKDNGGSFDSGISLFYLEYLLVGKRNDPAFAVEYVVKFISDNDYSARYIIPTYNSIHSTEAPNFSHLTLRA